MKIAVVGATGMAGSRIAAEAARCGHDVSGIARSETTRSENNSGTATYVADATDREAMKRVAAEHDVLVLATRPSPGSDDDVGSVISSVLDGAFVVGRRVLVVGGAGPLRSPDDLGRLVIDDERYVPQQWRAVAQSSIDQFSVCAGHEADCVYLSPPALFEPGTRTGTFRRGENQLLVDRSGKSWISAEDLAIAALDEIENPTPGVRHFTVGY